MFEPSVTAPVSSNARLTPIRSWRLGSERTGSHETVDRWDCALPKCELAMAGILLRSRRAGRIPRSAFGEPTGGRIVSMVSIDDGPAPRGAQLSHTTRSLHETTQRQCFFDWLTPPPARTRLAKPSRPRAWTSNSSAITPFQITKHRRRGAALNALIALAVACKALAALDRAEVDAYEDVVRTR